MSESTNQSGVQLSLFPVDDEERVLLCQGRLYQTLPDVGQQLVRAYLRMMRTGNGCRQADWIRETGLPSSTAHDAIKRYEAVLWPAIMEACQLLGVRGAQVGGMALVAAGVVIFRDLVAGRRRTDSLTQVELGIMRDCAAMSGVRLPGASAAGLTVVTPDGTRVEASAVLGTSEDEVRRVLAELQGRVDRTRAAGGEAGGADCVRGEAREVAAVPGPDLAAGSGEGDRGGDRHLEGLDPEPGPALGPAVSQTAVGVAPGTAGEAEAAEIGHRGSSLVAVLAVAAVLVLGVSAVGGVGGGPAEVGRPVGGSAVGVSAVGGSAGLEVGREEYGGGWGAMGRRANATAVYVSCELTRCEKISEKMAGTGDSKSLTAAAATSGVRTPPPFSALGRPGPCFYFAAGGDGKRSATVVGGCLRDPCPHCADNPRLPSYARDGLTRTRASKALVFIGRPALHFPGSVAGWLRQSRPRLRLAGFVVDPRHRPSRLALESLSAESAKSCPVDQEWPLAVGPARTPQFFRQRRKPGARACQAGGVGLPWGQGRAWRQGGGSPSTAPQCVTPLRRRLFFPRAV